MPKKRQGIKYVALVGLCSDRNGRQWQPGEYVTDNDFDSAIITNWLEIGAIIEAEQEAEDGGWEE